MLNCQTRGPAFESGYPAPVPYLTPLACGPNCCDFKSLPSIDVGLRTYTVSDRVETLSKAIGVTVKWVLGQRSSEVWQHARALHLCHIFQYKHKI